VTSDLVRSVLSQKSAHHIAENSFSNINSASHFFKMLMYESQKKYANVYILIELL
jgi:hypothetical protein